MLPSLVATPPEWGQQSHPMFAPHWHGEAGQDTLSHASCSSAHLWVSQGAGLRVHFHVPHLQGKLSSGWLSLEVAYHQWGLSGPAAAEVLLSKVQEVGSRRGVSCRPAELPWPPVLLVQLFHCFTALLWPWALVGCSVPKREQAQAPGCAGHGS